MRRLVLVFTVSLLLAGCGGAKRAADTNRFPGELPDGETVDTSLLPREVETGLNRPVLLELGPATVQLSVREIRDSRCPKGVNCVRAGEGSVTISVATISGNDALYERELKLLTTAEAPTRLGPLTYRLTGLDPYPAKDTPVNTAEYRARVLIEAAN